MNWYCWSRKQQPIFFSIRNAMCVFVQTPMSLNLFEILIFRSIISMSLWLPDKDHWMYLRYLRALCRFFIVRRMGSLILTPFMCVLLIYGYYTCQSIDSGIIHWFKDKINVESKMYGQKYDCNRDQNCWYRLLSNAIEEYYIYLKTMFQFHNNQSR